MRYVLCQSVLIASLATVSLFGAEGVLADLADITVSQRDKQFQPSAVAIETGQAVIIVNDDGTTVHHAYVESEAFNFDSGDQTPGTHTRVVFPMKGDFQVLCGIHPKMKLTVHVR